MEEKDTKDDNIKTSTSKNEVTVTKSDEEIVDDQVSNKSSVQSGSYQASRTDITEDRTDGLKRMGRGRRYKRRRSRVRRGRVSKRRRHLGKRQHGKVESKRKPRGRELRDVMGSAITLFSKASEKSRCTVPVCKYCGHRCCLRRWRRIRDRKRISNRRRKLKNKRMKKRIRRLRNKGAARRKIKTQISAKTQVGSRSRMFSPLFVATNDMPDGNIHQPLNKYSEITPQMIHESLRKLTSWRQNVQTDTLMNYLATHYPVNPNKDQLLEELKEKLRVACITGMVTCVNPDCWQLTCHLMGSKLSMTHVTKFWHVYGDTLKPVTKEETAENKNQIADQETTTDQIVIRKEDNAII